MEIKIGQVWQIGQGVLSDGERYCKKREIDWEHSIIFKIVDIPCLSYKQPVMAKVRFLTDFSGVGRSLVNKSQYITLDHFELPVYRQLQVCTGCSQYYVMAAHQVVNESFRCWSCELSCGH